MELTIHVHHHFDPGPGGEGVLHILRALQGKIENMATTLDDLVQQVTDEGTVIDGAVTLLDGLKAQLDAAGTDPAKLQALSDSIAASKQKLADAVARDTSGQPVPTA